VDTVFGSVELGRGREQVRAHLCHDLFAPVEYLRVEHATAILGDEDQVDVVLWTRLLLGRDVGSGDLLGVAGRRYVVCNKVPSASE
jgi:hypothetical protein